MFIEIERGNFVALDRIISFTVSDMNPGLTVVNVEGEGRVWIPVPVAEIVRKMRGSGVPVHALPAPDEPRRSHA